MTDIKDLKVSDLVPEEENSFDQQTLNANTLALILKMIDEYDADYNEASLLNKLRNSIVDVLNSD